MHALAHSVVKMLKLTKMYSLKFGGIGVLTARIQSTVLVETDTKVSQFTTGIGHWIGHMVVEIGCRVVASIL
jgi:hypothetical protein